jgi:hypothetical protein
MKHSSPAISFIASFSTLGAILLASCGSGSDGSSTTADVTDTVQEATFAQDYMVQTGTPSNIRFVSDPDNRAKTVLELTLQRDDPEAGMGHRTEVLGRHDGLGNKIEVRWYGFDFYIPSDWTPEPQPIAVAQLHGNDQLGLAPPLSLQVQGSEMFLMLQYNINAVTSATPPVSGNSVRSYPWRGSLTKGRWHRLVVRTFWSSSPGIGELDVWLDGILLVSQRATPNTYDTSNVVGGQNYAKTGLYAPYGLEANNAVRILSRGIVFGGPTARYQDIANALEK